MIESDYLDCIIQMTESAESFQRDRPYPYGPVHGTPSSPRSLSLLITPNFYVYIKGDSGFSKNFFIEINHLDPLGLYAQPSKSPMIQGLDKGTVS